MILLYYIIIILYYIILYYYIIAFKYQVYRITVYDLQLKIIDEILSYGHARIISYARQLETYLVHGRAQSMDDNTWLELDTPSTNRAHFAYLSRVTLL